MEKKHFVLGTAGHIDHGKTALVKALTGIDTDRLKEEKARGITIELGFAHLDEDELAVSVVDVPGHERFVRAMTAGATGIDVVMLTIAADEGVMPQTREHLAICDLLGVRSGFVALTKVDLVDEEWLDLVTEDTRTFCAGSFLEDKPIIPCSALTGLGLDQIRRTVKTLAGSVMGRPARGLLRLPLDRVFTMHGFGTVVTGTLLSGTLSVGEDVLFLPSELKAKIRGLEVHGKPVERAEAGQRLAVNLKGLEKSQLERGEVMVRDETISPTPRFDGLLSHLAWNRGPIRRRTPVMVLCGTTSREATVIPLQADEVACGSKSMVQIHLKKPVAVLPGDHFIVQGFQFNPQHGATTGGGVVVRSHPPRMRRFDPSYAELLAALHEAPVGRRVELELLSSGFVGTDEKSLVESVPFLPSETHDALEAMFSRKQAVLFDREKRGVVHADGLAKLMERIMEELTLLSEASPMAFGFPRQEIFSKLPPSLSPKLFRLALDQLEADKKVFSDQESLQLPQARHAARRRDLEEKVLAVFESAGLTPARLAEIAAELSVSEKDLKDVVAQLVRKGELVRAPDNLWFHAGHVEELKRKLVAFLEKNKEITTLQFKEMAGVSRKHLIPLAEMFDDQRVTLRTGDVRKLRKG